MRTARGDDFGGGGFVPLIVSAPLGEAATQAPRAAAAALERMGTGGHAVRALGAGGDAGATAYAAVADEHELGGGALGFGLWHQAQV